MISATRNMTVVITEADLEARLQTELTAAFAAYSLRHRVLFHPSKRPRHAAE